MTNAQIIALILHEITGKPVQYWADVLAVTAAKIGPGRHKFYEECTQKEVDQLLQRLRAERPGILAWLVEGAMEANAWEDKVKGQGKANEH